MNYGMALLLHVFSAEGVNNVCNEERRKTLHSKKNRVKWFRFAKLHLSKPQNFKNNVLWTNETIVDMFSHNAQCHIWQPPNTANLHKHIPTIRHSNGGVKI